MGLYAYYLLLVDNIASNFILTPRPEYIFQILGKWDYSKILTLLTTACGSVVAITLNYLVGKMIYHAIKFYENKTGHKLLVKTSYNNKEFFERYKIIFLLASVWPFGGKFVQVVAGFHRIKFRLVLLVCFLCKMSYYLVSIIF